MTPIYTDLSTLNQLRDNSSPAPARLEDAAEQFAAIFLQMTMKSMREAGFGDGLLDNQQSLMYRDLYDQQLALELSQSEGFGLAELIVKQLGGSTEPPPPVPENAAAALVRAYGAVETTQVQPRGADNIPTEFGNKQDRQAGAANGKSVLPVAVSPGGEVGE